MTTCEPQSNGGSPNPDLPLTSSAAASHAKTSPTRDEGSGFVESGPVSGLTWPTPFAFYDLATSSWRTSQPSLFEDLTSLQETWPRSGMTSSGTAFLLLPSAPLTDVTGGGQWPTPRATDSMTEKLATVRARLHGGSPYKSRLEEAVAMATWPTPSAWLGRRPAHMKCSPTLRHAEASFELTDAVGQAGDTGQLNPTWVEWLMGFPPGWLEIDSKP